MEKDYAQAIANALVAGADENAAFANLLEGLKAQGRTKLLPGILRELKAIREARTSSAVLEIASAGEERDARAAAEREGVDVGSVSVNPDLIRGWRGRAGNRLVDRSAKRALVELYKKVTA